MSEAWQIGRGNDWCFALFAGWLCDVDAEQRLQLLQGAGVVCCAVCLMPTGRRVCMCV
jgi:hypothetical protein